MKAPSPIKRSAPPSRRTGLKPGRPPKRSAVNRSKKGKRALANSFSEEVKAAVRRRSRNRCEIRAEGLCAGDATQFHHRKLRAHGDNREVNCLHGCTPCHDHVHAKDGRGSITKSRLMGWIVDSWLDPAKVPVKRGGA